MDRSALLKEFGFKDEEVKELYIGDHVHRATGFPMPIKSYRLSFEMFDLSLEEPYYWILEDMRQNFPIIEKLEDAYGAAENSAFFGVTQQRLGAQQDKVSQFLATTGKMIKELFQMVRELRIIDERVEYYQEAEAQLPKLLDKRLKGSEVTLKGIFIDLVQGGGKSAASVYGMARELEFITLPDLFFDAPPFRDTEEMEKFVNSLDKDFNLNVVRVLKRHLRHFMEWKKRTFKEHMNRRTFQLKYLRQHFEIIQMYINWIKPYLRHVAKLTLKQKGMDSPEVISAFESGMIDIEFLGRIRDEKTGGNICGLCTFNYRTRAEMKVVQEGYQRGPVHIGRYEMNLRLYMWNDTQVENYKKLKEKEAMLLFGEVSAAVQSAMEALGEELDRYLEEAKGDIEKKVEKKEPDKKSLGRKMFGDFYTPKDVREKMKKDKPKSVRQLKAAEAAQKAAMKKLYKIHTGIFFTMYKNFKKAHRMIMW
jgi:hypothetical protein